VDFHGSSHKKRGESGEISFYPLENEKTTFFAKNFIGKCEISKSRGGQVSSCPPSGAHAPKTSVSSLLVKPTKGQIDIFPV